MQSDESFKKECEEYNSLQLAATLEGVDEAQIKTKIQELEESIERNEKFQKQNSELIKQKQKKEQGGQSVQRLIEEGGREIADLQQKIQELDHQIEQKSETSETSLI